MSNIQDLEQEFMRCWDVSQDLDLLAQEYKHDDDLWNKILGIKNVYEMRFSKAWDTYEKVVEEHYAWKKREVNFDDEHLTQEPVQLELDFGYKGTK
jgi:hypothetical protein